MSTRLQRIGTIFSRVDGAIRKGLIKENNIPIWFKVYKRFPPKYEPRYTSQTKATIPDIFYKEDILRAEIHKICSKNQEVISLTDEKVETQSQKLLKTCQQYISDGMTEQDALKKIAKMVHLRDTQNTYENIMQNMEEIIAPAKIPK